MRKLLYGTLAVGMVLTAMVTDAAASVVAVPEINPGAVTTGLAVLAGGVLLARARWRK